jgi:predicted CXXCH cytochrome family protein
MRNLVANDQKEGINHHFQRLGTNYFLELAFAQPVAIFIGSQGIAMKQSLPDKSSGALETGNNSHDDLSSKQDITLEVCRSCHQNQNTATHPVNVYPKPGMIIPPEYPTLPDGRITCMSCHEAHGSDYEFLMIVSGKRELCIGCHRDMI